MLRTSTVVINARHFTFKIYIDTIVDNVVSYTTDFCLCMSVARSLFCSNSLRDIYVPISHCFNHFGFIIVLGILCGKSPNLVLQKHCNNYLPFSIPSECQDYFVMYDRNLTGNYIYCKSYPDNMEYLDILWYLWYSLVPFNTFL